MCDLTVHHGRAMMLMVTGGDVIVGVGLGAGVICDAEFGYDRCDRDASL